MHLLHEFRMRHSITFIPPSPPPAFSVCRVRAGVYRSGRRYPVVHEVHLPRVYHEHELYAMVRAQRSHTRSQCPGTHYPCTQRRLNGRSHKVNGRKQPHSHHIHTVYVIATEYHLFVPYPYSYPYPFPCLCPATLVRRHSTSRTIHLQAVTS